MKPISILLAGLLSASLFACTKSDDDACTLASCDSAVTGTFAVTVTAPADLVGAVVTLCRDGVCATSTIADTSQGGAPNYECPLTASNPLSCYVILSGSEPPKVRVIYEVDPQTTHDGEHFTTTVVKASGENVLSSEKDVQYKDVPSNVPDCNAVCRSATLE